MLVTFNYCYVHVRFLIISKLFAHAVTCYRIRIILQKYMGPQLFIIVGIAMWPYFNL